MNRKEKSAKFLTWNRKAGGFTLIELVVVIAIMAIIAGVAVPVYNGYINKANQAADEQLLAAVNRAAAAAVLEERNVDMATLADGALEADITSTIAVKYKEPDAPVAAFTKYFAGNDGASFKYYNSLSFKNGVFVGARSIAAAVVAWVRESVVGADGKYTISNGTETIKVLATDMANMNSSVFIGGEMSVATLTGDVDKVLKSAAKVLEDDEATMSSLASLLQAYGIDPNNADQVAKVLMLHTARNTVGTNVDTIIGQVRMNQEEEGSFAKNFGTHIGSEDKTQAFVDAAMAYAMVEAFANTNAGQTAQVTVNGVLKDVPDYLASVGSGKEEGSSKLQAVMNMLSTLKSNCRPFQRYLNSDDAKTDLQGYLSAMNAINDNIENIDKDRYLTEGMSGPYMQGLVGQFDLSSGT